MAFNNPMQFVDLENEVRDKGRLGNTTADNQRISDWINNAYYEVCIETDFYESSSSSASLTANSTSVSVPSSIVKIEYITATGSDGTLWGPMAEVTFEEILELRAWMGGVVSTGAPSRYAFRSSSSPSIEFFPQAVGGEVLTFYGLLLPTALSSPTDPVIFPEPYSKAIIYRALIHAAQFKKDLLMLNDFRSDYQDWLQRFRAFNNTRNGSKVQQMRVEGQRPIPRRNDVDTGY